MNVEFSARAHDTARQVNREKLPALVLDNTVLEVNPSFEGTLPFDIRQGTKGEWALFFGGEGESDRALGTREFHWRSGDLTNTVFHDKQGRPYRDTDLKGCGYLKVNESGKIYAVQWKKDTDTHHYGYYGLFDRERALNDARVSEFLTDNGVRTHRSLAIFELKELPIGEGQALRRVPIEELKERGLLDEQYHPAIQLRAFGTKTRLGEKLVAGDFEDAIALVETEIGTRFNSYLEYVDWFVDSLAVNIGRMHRLGYVHRYFTEYNVTLDCRIVDLDAAKKTGDIPKEEWEDARRRDIGHKRYKRGARGVIGSFVGEMERHFSKKIGYLPIEQLYKRFEDRYAQESGLLLPSV